MFCPNCGTQLADDARFCPDCGTQLEQMARAQFDYGGDAAEQPQEENGFQALGRTMGYMAKFWFLCAVAAIAICAVIGVIVWLVESKDDPKPFNGAMVKAQTVWDASGLHVESAKLVDPDFGYDALVLKVKNETGRDLTIRAISLAINGASDYAYLEQTAPNGKTQEMNLGMDYYHKYLGVETPGTLTFELQALDPSGGEEVLRSGILTVRTTMAENVQNASFKGYFDKYTDLFEESGIRVGTFGYLADPIGPGFGFDNTTGKPIRVTVEIKSISGREMIARDKYYINSAVIQQGAIGTCFVRSDFEQLKRMDVDGNGDVFPVKKMTGIVTIENAYDGSLIAEVPFDYSED